jgi:hypothetical protein
MISIPNLISVFQEFDIPVSFTRIRGWSFRLANIARKFSLTQSVGKEYPFRIDMFECSPDHGNNYVNMMLSGHSDLGRVSIWANCTTFLPYSAVDRCIDTLSKNSLLSRMDEELINAYALRASALKAKERGAL